ncbi:MAG: tripartite tricarboxylate transporter substrate-binding protein, partial [Pseudomonadota bacterium]
HQAAIDGPECIAPANPGGGFDLTCRIAQNGLEPALTEPMQVTFMPGGVGAVAINLFNTTRTDDASAIVAFSSGSLLNMATGKFGQWDEDDVRFLAAAGADYGAVVVPGDSEYQSLDDLMAALEADVGSIAIGAGGGVGSQDWMKGALLVRSRDLDPREMRYVAFDGGGEAIAALLGGSIQAYMGDVGEMVPYMETDEMRILAVMSPERLPDPFAEIPTTAELGYDGAEWVILRGFYMGKDVPDADYQAYVDAFQAAYDTPEWAQIVNDQGLSVVTMSGADFQADVQGRVDRMREIAREAGLIQ